MNPDRIDWRLYVIIDPSALTEPAAYLDVASAAIDGGAGVIQLRDKQATARELLARARALSEICRRHGVPLIINDRVDIALAAGADGVHLGPDDLPVADARQIAPDLLIGGSAGTPDSASQLVDAGVNYLGSGAVFDARPSKPDAHHERGVEALARVVEAVDVPVVGIGGIDASNARHVAGTGAAGIAVIRAVCRAADAETASRRLLAAFSD